MSRILGLNIGRTKHGKQLKDGATCILEDGNITVAIAEERVSRIKNAGGFTNSLTYCLSSTGYRLDDFDLIIMSTCCEDASSQEVEGLAIGNKSKLQFIPSHHLSHAYSAFCVSPFDRSLIVVMDGGGNTFGTSKHIEWWKNYREQNSYYIGDGTNITLIDRDFDRPFEVGFGEAYRYFTYYLGWQSSVNAGTIMALAAYGDPKRFANVNIFMFDKGHLQCSLINDPFNPFDVIRNFAKSIGSDLGNPRDKSDQITQIHYDLALLIQNQLEEALVKKINYLYEQTGIQNLCIAGGVGFNCLANSRILERTPINNIFVQPAAGDQGQALGNTLYGYHHLYNKQRSFVMTNAYTGIDYSKHINDALFKQLIGDRFRWVRSENIAKDSAYLISEGFVIGWFQGKSEYGPRALGNRSILADPRSNTVKNLLDQDVKKREWFRPYAPSILKEFATEFFCLVGESPFMTLTAQVRNEKAYLIPAVLHVDKSARLQIVSKDQNLLFYELINEYRKITGIPLVLNTSFNGRDMPIVETPEDAILCFEVSPGMDALIIENYIIMRNHRIIIQ